MAGVTYRPLTSLLRLFPGSLLAAALIAPVATGACVEVEPDPLVDEEGEPVPLPGPHDRWLEIASISPAADELALEPRLVVTFNDHLDDDSFRSYNFASLRSGGLVASGRAHYIMTDKTVVWEPYSELESQLAYGFSVNEDLTSATGAPLLLPAEWPRYEVSDETEQVEPPQLPHATFEDVEPIFEAHCVDCHRDEKSGLNPLTYDSLVGTRSEQTSLYLVRPGDPADSYLMRKLLWDYPDIEFTHQPPPWAEGAEELERDKLLIIEGWISSGARP